LFEVVDVLEVCVRAARFNVARGGYTGEDGFEVRPPFSNSPLYRRQRVHILQISIVPTDAVEVAKHLSQAPVQLTGLGARDSLRPEAGMCPCGQDLDEDTSPVEAGLSWAIGKERRESGGFIGADLVLKHLNDGPPRRVGFIVEGAPARRKSPFFFRSSSFT
jgi:aminomethyltransferase